MRITCPNCGTQYEVDASAIPVAGRDVQCGTCSTTWFQPPEGVKLPPELERSGLRDWEAPEATATPELPGEAPEIDTAPNKEIVSEPEVEGLIESTELADKTPHETVAPQTKNATQNAEQAPLPEQEESPAPTQPFVSENRQHQRDVESAPKTTETAAGAASIAAASAALAKNTSDTPIQENSSSQPKTADAEPADSEIIEADTLPHIDPSDGLKTESLRQETEDPKRIDGDFQESAVAEDVNLTTEQTLASPPSDTAEPAPAKQVSEEAAQMSVAEEIRAAAQDLSPENKPGSPLPEDLSNERLADYDTVVGVESGKAELIEQAVDEAFETSDLEENLSPSDGYSAEELRNQVRSAMDSAIEDQSSRLVSGTFGDSDSSNLDDEIGVTESLAAKLKARVAEAAEAQSIAEPKTTQTGTLLAASAAGVAAAANQRVTEFPKRETEDLSTSLRPKSLARSGLKPGLRPAATPEPKQSRFRFGFITAILVFSLLAMLYAFRLPVSELVPPLTEPLTVYAQAVDKVRLIIQDSFGQLLG